MKKIISAFIFALLSQVSFSQLDSTSVQLYFLPEYLNPADSTMLYDVAVMTLTMDDVDDLGMLSVVVYDNTSNQTLLEIIRTRQELLDQGFINSTGVEFPLFNAESGQSYLVEVNPQNLAGAYTRSCQLIVTN